MKVTVFGVGYVGLVHACVLASCGHSVCCVDLDTDKIEKLKQGQVPFYEPGLEPLLRDNLLEGRLRFTTHSAEGVEFGDIVFIAVGTPATETGTADLRQVLGVAQEVAQHLQQSKLVVIRSTVPVGTQARVSALIQSVLDARGISGLQVDVASNPEFLKQGSAVLDASKPDRIVVGTTNPHSVQLLRELYEGSNRNHEKMLVMDPRSAELCKYAANSMLATKISLMNELAQVADQVGADIEQVRRGIGSDQRIGYDFIYPGIGFGGSCFPKDVEALIHMAQDHGVQPAMLQAVQQRNALQKQWMFDKIHCHYHGQLQGKRIALWGLSFKPNTNDMRDAPSRVLMDLLWQAGAVVQAYDPQAMEEAQRIYGHRNDLRLCGTKEAALVDADALLICTEWKTFVSPDLDFMKAQLRDAVVFDGRNVLDPVRLHKHGLTVYSVGRDHLVRG